MPPTNHNQNPNRRGTTAPGAAALPSDYRVVQFDESEHSPPQLRPGAAIVFTMAAVIALLTFIEIVFS